MCDFKVDQIVICINDGTLFYNELTIGKEYIITDIIRDGGIFINPNKMSDCNKIGVLVLNDNQYFSYYDPKLFIDKISHRCGIIDNILYGI